jgi:acetyl-CoA carboxylase carboxyl transferase subunit alpha|tara:strand:- start:651 stop:1754 length:1104 start_codon:yes stop_codon:yes gene_type:complete
MQTYLDFEKPIEELDLKIIELKEQNLEYPSEETITQIAEAEQLIKNIYKKIFSTITPWQKTQISRHPERPKTQDYIDNLITDFFELAGDRSFAEDKAITGGFGRFRGQSVLVLGHEKGHDTNSRIKHNFGMPKPEGYRKAIRLMKLAEQFDMPVISFVDTPGAYPGLGAEQRGQGDAIAKATECCLSLGVPIIVVIIGEGGSGGAVAIGTGNNVLMLENSIYSVISPEGCSSILWKDSSKAPEAAEALKLTAADMLKVDVIDKIIPEPLGGGHRNRSKVIEDTGNAIEEYLKALSNQHGNELKHSRQERYLQIGRNGLFSEKTSAANEALDSKFGKIREPKNFIKHPVFIGLIAIIGIAALGFYWFN